MLDLLFGPPSRAAVTIHSEVGWSGGGTGRRTRAGVTVSEDVALTYEAVFRATCVLAEGVGGVPLPLYERVNDTDRRPADLDVGELLKFQPNPDMTAITFRESRTAQQVNWAGGGFAEIERDRRTGRIVALWPIHPCKVRKPTDGSEFQYMVRGEDGREVGMYADEILHISGALADDGIWSRGVISYGREAIGGGLAADRASYAIQSAGGPSRGILTAPGMNDRSKKSEFRREWNEIHGNPDVNVPTFAILPPGWTWQDIGGLGAEASGLIATRAVNKSNVATLYGIPAYKINADGKETAGTIEQKAIDFVTYSLMPWSKKWEEQCNFKLLDRDERKRFYFEHNFNGLLRGDANNRFNAYQKGLMWGYLTINQVCRLENLPNIGPAGDQHFVPANMTTAERAMEGDMGNGGAVGSDMSGRPAQAPPGREQPDEEAFNKWLAGMSNIMRDEAKAAMSALQERMEDRKIDYGGVARVALVDVLGRIYKKESYAASQAAAKKDLNFDQWLHEFFASHAEQIAERLVTACMALEIAGVKKWSDKSALAWWLAVKSKAAIRDAYNSDTREAFARRMDEWPTRRAEMVADEILKG